MTYRNKVYIAFDGDNDIRYYWLMHAWKHNKSDFFETFNFYDAHKINYARDSSQEESIKRQLSIRLDISKLFILLVGNSTRYLYKFVKWEIDQAIKREIPIIVVNLNGKRHMDSINCPPVLLKHTVIHISFNQKIIEHALTNWPSKCIDIVGKGESGPFYYTDQTYSDLGL